MVMEGDYYFNRMGQLVSEDGSAVLTLPVSKDSAASNGYNDSKIMGDSPCLVYVKVGSVLYLDLEQSKKNSPPLVTERMIMEAARDAHGELPLLGGLEKRVVEERRRQAMERWVNQLKEERPKRRLLTTSAFP